MPEMPRHVFKGLCWLPSQHVSQSLTSPDSHSPSLAEHHQGDRQMDRQTAALQRIQALPAGQLDRQSTVHGSRRTDEQTDTQTAPHRPASSWPCIVWPQAPSCGRCSLRNQWEAVPWHRSCVGLLGTTSMQKAPGQAGGAGTRLAA